MNSKINRMALKNSDIVYGSLEEQQALRLDPGDYMSCGDPMQGVERCPFADECTFAFKGAQGMERVVDVDPKTVTVKTTKNDKGEEVPVVKEHPACGPKMLSVYRRDGWTGKSRILQLPCYRLLSNRKRWDRQDNKGRKDLVAILAREGDGKMVPMQETSERHAGTNRDGRPKFLVDHVKVYRATPFHPRPAELMPERQIDLEVEDLLRQRAVEDNAVVIAGLHPEDRPIDVSSGAIPQVMIHGEEKPRDVRQAARRAQGTS